MKKIILKYLFPEEYARLQELEKVRILIVHMFPEYRPYICGEDFTSTMLSIDPIEILECYSKGDKNNESKFNKLMHNTWDF